VEDEGLEPTHPFTDVRFSKPLHYHSANLPKKNLGLVSQDFGGKSRIRTHGTLAGTSDFKSDAIDQLCHFSVFFVPPTGFEPVTYGLENRCSIRLSYKGMFYNYKVKPFLRNIYNLNQNFLLKFQPSEWPH